MQLENYEEQVQWKGDEKTIQAKDLSIAFSSSYLHSGELFLPAKISNIHVGNKIFVDCMSGNTFISDDMKSFRYLAQGTIIGTYKEYALIRNRELLFYDGKRLLQLQFGVRDGHIYHSLGASISASEILNISRCCMYKCYAVFELGHKIIFLNVKTKKMNIYTVEHDVVSFNSPEIAGMKFFEIILGNSTKILFYNHSYLFNDHASVSFPAVIESNRYASILRFLEYKDVVTVLRDSSDAAKPEFKLKMANFIASYSTNSDLIISQLPLSSTFYSVPENFIYDSINYGSTKIKHEKSDAYIANIVNRTYTRRFFYIPKLQDSNNLAYYVIRKERSNRRLLQKSLSNKTFVFKSIADAQNAYRRILGDERLEEVIGLMFETETEIKSDIADTAKCCQKMLEMRVLASAGNALMANKHVKINMPVVVPQLDKDMNIPAQVAFRFFYGMCMAEFSKELPSDRFATKFGRMFYDLITKPGDATLQSFKNAFNNIMFERNYLHVPFALLLISAEAKAETECGIESDSFISQSITNLLGAEAPSGLLDFLISQITSKNFNIKINALVGVTINSIGSNNQKIYRCLVNETKKFGPLENEKNEEFYDRKYRAMAALCASLVSTMNSPVKLEDTYCELLINGMGAIGSGRHGNLLHRNSNARPAEMFYSVLFKLLNTWSTRPAELVKSIHFRNTAQCSVYQNSAKIFYIGLCYFKRELFENEAFENSGGRDEITSVLNLISEAAEFAESQIAEHPHCDVLLRFSLVTLSIFKNASFDLGLIRTIRRLLLQTKSLSSISYTALFDKNKKDFGPSYGPGFNNLLCYKLCMGFVCAGMGTTQLAQDLKDRNAAAKTLIAAFYLCDNFSLEFNYIDMFKMFLPSLFVPNKAFEEKLASEWAKQQKRKKSKKTTAEFIKRFGELQVLEQKIVVDVLSDFYENHSSHESGAPLLNMTVFGNILASFK
ncbi:hypothetical protein ENBRE01_0466 [Enteropsectra breve]|nr:hypothetical protein ENBRE01_0466 [Enteropsectra breve]